MQAYVTQRAARASIQFRRACARYAIRVMVNIIARLLDPDAMRKRSMPLYSARGVATRDAPYDAIILFMMAPCRYARYDVAQARHARAARCLHDAAAYYLYAAPCLR